MSDAVEGSERIHAKAPLEEGLAELEGAGVAQASRAEILETLAQMVLHPEYPCLGARAVFNRERATVRVFDELAGQGVAEQLTEELEAFAGATDTEEGLASFVAAFRGPPIEDETHFERLLWQQLGQVVDADERPWDPHVSDNPDDPHFAFSVAGTAYFVVGLHPRASRVARRTPIPVLVFNPHEQFEALRVDGRFEKMRDTIRRRDAELQGSVNPMVADHGQASEARQYSGRRLDEDWEPPFEPGAESGADQ